MSFGDYMLFIVSAILVNNILLAKFLGNCPFLGVSKRMDTATGMSMAVIFVMVMAGMITWLVQYYILVPLNIEYLQTIAFILVIAALVQLVEIVMAKSLPALYRALGIFLPLITTNCAVLGVAIININEEYDFVDTLVFSLASALGYSLALILFAGIRERFMLIKMPKAFQGTSIGLVVAGFLALAFSGFAGLVGGH
ncbi:MAG: electron transport complex subunit RsxA [Desulfarculus sp.]|nr:electron transport complex subunit RsxA [Pseudomonadota bacterium]MBU4573914.1 electron transport complex subunit RsxA [Pseudomonadota bacterium]MBU4597605.1 electron transport complex subunit RsxA [Pseudomonadota bacterium]MBV1716982.1 electron transport complex subunit RsxA [Desulfarculus sp.]MBV1736558.1 electron transport complex subunit RsxA [Desulfarculus sp.]